MEEEVDFRYALVTSGWNLPTFCQANLQTTKSMKATADTPRLAPKPLTMLVESGASGHCFDDELLSDPKAKHLNCKELCKALVWPHNILAAGRHALPGTATGVISKQINDMDGNKHPVENSGLVAPGRHNRFLTLLLLPKLEDKVCKGVLCGYSLNSKAYRMYRNKTARATESRNVIFIETPASTIADSTEGNTTGDAVSTHEDSSPVDNTEDISITYSEEIDSFLKKVSKLTCRNMDPSTSAGLEELNAEGAGSDETLKRPRQEHCRPTTNSEAQYVWAHAQIVP